jgi:tetratricopeptide (TPR) repeat protein
MFKRNLSSAQLHYADLLASKKNYPAAIEHYRGALFADPGNGPADYNLDNCLRHLGKNPMDAAYRQSLAEGAESTPGHFNDAVVEYRKCAKIQEGMGIPYYRLGSCLIRGGKIADGYKELLTAVRKSWSDADQITLAECHVLMGDTLKDAAMAAKSNTDRSKYVKRLNNAAVEYRRASTLCKQNMAAVRGLTEIALEAVGIQPTFNNYITLGGAYVLQGDFDRAKVAYEKAWRADPANALLPKVRRVYHHNVVTSAVVPITRVAESVQKLEEQLRKEPTDTELLYLVARGKEKLGETAEAVGLLEKALSINKYANPDIQATLARLTGKSPTAQPGTPGSTSPGAGPTTAATGSPGKEAQAQAAAQALISKIESLVQEGKFDEADQQCDQILATTPREGKAWLFKGKIQEKKNNLDDAATNYRQAAGLGIKDAEAAMRQVNSLRVQPLQKDADKFIQEKNWPEAASVLREITILAPNLPGPMKQLMDVLKQTGDTKEVERLAKKVDDLEKQK